MGLFSMSLETIRQLASKRFADFQGLPNTAKFYPNLKEPTPPASGVWAKFRIEPVLRYVSSIGSQPCSRRNGSIVIELFDRLDAGTANIIKVADALEQWFSYYQVENLWLGAAKTYLDGQTELEGERVGMDKQKTSVYAVRVYIPFEYDEN